MGGHPMPQVSRNSAQAFISIRRRPAVKKAAITLGATCRPLKADVGRLLRSLMSLWL
jgi:hypothetical protein